MKQLYEKLLEKARIKPRPKPENTGPRYADLNDRALAAGIDVLVLYFLLFPLFLWIQQHVYAYVDWELLRTMREEGAASTAETWRAMVEAGQPQLWLVNALIQVVIIGVVIVSVQVHFGATPGKSLMGLKIVDAKTLEPPALWQYIVRFIGYIPALAVFMVGIFWISFNKERRGWHDHLARTVVVHTRPHGWYWQQFKRGFFWLKNKLSN